MHFTLKAADLNKALNIVSIVTPTQVTQQGAAGYLFKTDRDKDGNPRCRIYSRNSNEAARAELPLSDLEGEGSFVSPVNFLSNLRYILDTSMTFEVKSEAGVHSISYQTSSGAVSDTPSFDPRLIAPIDKDVDAVDVSKTKTYPAGVLSEAVRLSKKFLAEAKNNEEYLKTVQIFDDTNEAWSKGNGNMFATNGTKAFFFYSEAFEKNGFALHLTHLDGFVSFLGKCSGDVEIRYGDRMMFAVNKTKADGETVFGWAYHDKKHTKFSTMPSKHDKYTLRMPKLVLVNAINYTKLGLEAGRDKTRINFSAKDNSVSFSITDSAKKLSSFPVPAEVQGSDAVDFAYNLNLHQLLELVEDVKGNEVLLRVAPLPVDERRPKGGAAFRTIDDFWMDPAGEVLCGVVTEKDEAGNEKRPTKDAIKCRVTRFMPSKD